MSYILEALKKSEQERNIGHVPDLAAVQETLPTRAARWPWILSVALLVNALALALFAWKPWEARVAPPAPVAERVAPLAAPPQQQPQVAEPASAIAPSVPAATESAAPAATAIPSMQTRKPDEMAQTLQPHPIQATAAAPASETFAPDAEPGMEQAGRNTDAIPRWDDLPADQRSRLPTPRMDVHVFAQDPARRFVMIDLRKYQEGDRLPQGVTLVAIRAEGIVLSYQGQQYRVERP